MKSVCNVGGRLSLITLLAVFLLFTNASSTLAKKHHHEHHQTHKEAVPDALDNTQTSTATATSADNDAIGISDPGTVRVNNLANLEALLNIIANSVEILGIALSGPLLLAGIILLCFKGKRILGGILAFMSVFCFVGGIAFPGIINWLVASARDANLFS